MQEKWTNLEVLFHKLTLRMSTGVFESRTLCLGKFWKVKILVNWYLTKQMMRNIWQV